MGAGERRLSGTRMGIDGGMTREGEGDDDDDGGGDGEGTRPAGAASVSPVSRAVLSTSGAGCRHRG